MNLAIRKICSQFWEDQMLPTEEPAEEEEEWGEEDEFEEEEW